MILPRTHRDRSRADVVPSFRGRFASQAKSCTLLDRSPGTSTLPVHETTGRSCLRESDDAGKGGVAGSSALLLGVPADGVLRVALEHH